MQTDTCPYKRFVGMLRDKVRNPWVFEIYTGEAFKGVEAALWPHLYHHQDLCESYLEGKQSRASSKVSFMTKIRSAVLDYGLQYEFLHYHYDRWLFKMITGAINTAAKSGCSPAKGLEAKTFSHQYWKNQHHLLIDAVRQFGYPTLFLTLSPFEWTFPFPQWLEDIRDLTGRGPTELPMHETQHIAHCLEQIVRGYVAGKNTNHWKSTLFSFVSCFHLKDFWTFFSRK